MSTIRHCLFMFLICHRVITEANSQSSISRGKGQTDNKPIYVSNYIPATMHVIFHLTDHLKYDLKPGATNPSTTTTIRPTPPHKPGYYAPNAPPGPAAYNSREAMNDDQFRTWRFGYLSNQFPKQNPQTDLPQDVDLFGAGPSELLHQVNTLEDVDTIGDDDEDDQIQRFAVNYEDTVNLDFLKQKRRPPTRAYVDLLSLYNLLNLESKELNLNKYNGYSDIILRELIKTSTGSSSDQLKFVFTKVLEKQNTKKINILNKIKNLRKELEKPDGYLNDAIKYIPAMQFAS